MGVYPASKIDAESIVEQIVRGTSNSSRSDVNDSKSKVKPSNASKKGNVHFQRAVFAAEIIDRLCEERTFGHVKFEKTIFLAEHILGVDIGSNYSRAAAGPLGGRAIRSIDSQIKKQKWFHAKKDGNRYHYERLESAGKHKICFNRYYGHLDEEFTWLIELLRDLRTIECEKIATLYSAWYDLLSVSKQVNDETVVIEVLTNWHPDKSKISESDWKRTLSWMKENSLVPEVRGS